MTDENKTASVSSDSEQEEQTEETTKSNDDNKKQSTEDTIPKTALNELGFNPDDLQTKDGWLTNLTFDQLDINDNLRKALKENDFTKMTEIQAKSIPSLLAGKDLLAQAKTGSGKTLAFLVPCIELLWKAKFKQRNGTGVIIIAPTRELALQIYAVASQLMKYCTQTHTVVMGGANKHYEEQQLIKGASLVVATPGRLLDHLMNTKFNFNNLLCLVIDEADRILEVGFEEELKAIVQLLPKKRQTMLFSATQTTKVADIARLSLKGSPVSVGVEEKKKEVATVQKLEQGYVLVPPELKFQLLFTFLKKNLNKKIIVFFSSCASVKYHTEILNYIDIPVIELHGKLKQKKRTNTFFNFCNSEKGILLCTDVAARGLDIPAVDWIIQYDPPDNPKEYIHRVGRTARAGRKGKALLFLLPTEKGFLKYLKDEQVPLNELAFPQKKLANIQSKLEKIISTNYYLNRSAKEGFAGYIRSYAAHALKDIFSIHDLDVQNVAKAFGLPSVPYVDMKSLEVPMELIRKKRKQRETQWIRKGVKKQKQETSQ